MILSIETSGKTCSVSLSNKGTTIHTVETATDAFIHAEKLTLFIQQLLHETNTLLNQLEAVAVSEGPGSFTGLRIGVATAKGLCYGLNIPLIAINSLYILNATYQNNATVIANETIIPMVDARRMEVYCAYYEVGSNIINPSFAKIIDENAFLEVNKKITLIGDGADKCFDLDFTNKAIQIIPNIKPSAAHMSAKAFELYQNKTFEDLAYFEPNYTKAFGEITV